jgi:hypothetical protein
LYSRELQFFQEKERNFMSRLSLSIVATLAAAMALSPLTASSQVERAALDLPAFSSASASAPDSFAAPARSSAAAAAPASNVAEGSSHPFSSVGVGVKVGLGGIGFDVAAPLIPGRLNIRGGAGFFSYTYNGTVDNEPISATLKLDNAEAMVDLFPFKGSFRLSAGTTVYNTTGLNGTVTVAAGSKITIGNDSYTSSATIPLTGTVAAGFGSKAVPRFTLGWGNMVAKNHHVRFETEFGVEIIGTPTVAWAYGGQACLNGSNGTCSTPYQSISSIPGATADIAVQTSELQNDLNGVKVFPIFSFGLSYKIGH